METRFSKKAKVFDICITAFAAVLSVGIMIYGVFHFGLQETWPELVLNLFYIACLVMMWMYFFNIRITSEQFNYWTSDPVARHPLPAPVGLLLYPPVVSLLLSVSPPYAHLFLCP